jgi:hypothetical protein
MHALPNPIHTRSSPKHTAQNDTLPDQSGSQAASPALARRSLICQARGTSEAQRSRKCALFLLDGEAGKYDAWKCCKCQGVQLHAQCSIEKLLIQHTGRIALGKAMMGSTVAKHLLVYWLHALTACCLLPLRLSFCFCRCSVLPYYFTVIGRIEEPMKRGARSCVTFRREEGHTMPIIAFASSDSLVFRNRES